MALVSAKDIATKWGISQRRVATLCSENRIEGAIFVANAWIIPENALKPLDARKKDNQKNNLDAKPFLKWAGGKGQLLKEISAYYPFEKDKTITKYAEPFVGGGAVLFDVLNKFSPDEVYISDINKDLIDAYIAIRDNVDGLIEELETVEKAYLSFDKVQRADDYRQKRDRFNALKHGYEPDSPFEKAALLIFLNRTCFNGLYRVNKKGDFNVPFNRIRTINFDFENMYLAGEVLKNVRILQQDFNTLTPYVTSRTFIYVDPPYRPVNKAVAFTDFTKDAFNDEDQIRLGNWAKETDKLGAAILLSNSNPQSGNEEDTFFTDLYKGFDIFPVSGKRSISSKLSGRGKTGDLLIKNQYARLKNAKETFSDN